MSPTKFHYIVIASIVIIERFLYSLEREKKMKVFDTWKAQNRDSTRQPPTHYRISSGVRVCEYTYVASVARLSSS